MGTIWKFRIPILDDFEIEMPRDAEFLMVGAQDLGAYLWARVVPERDKEVRKFKLRGTGHLVDLDCEHVGSFLIRGGALVYHLFEDNDKSSLR
jgi:hypothetical protein